MSGCNKANRCAKTPELEYPFKNILSFTTNPLSCSKIDFALQIILTTCSSIL